MIQMPIFTSKPSTSYYNATKDQQKEVYFTLTILLQEPYCYVSNITIFNNKLERVALPIKENPDPFTRKYTLAPGRYTVRIEINCQVRDTIVDLDKDKTFVAGRGFSTTLDHLGVPELYSSALMTYAAADYGSSHEYYSEPAMEISKMETGQPGTWPTPQSGLFIFLRFPTYGSYRSTYRSESYWDRFTLYNANSGRQVAHFPHDCITDTNTFPWNLEPGSGYLGFSANLGSGLYYLTYNGEDNRSRIIPIYIYEGWYTQFFMTVAEQPLFGTIRIFIANEKRFNPAEKNNVYTDICLCKLQNNDFTLDEALIQNIAFGKFDSPMLGLLGAYLYLSSNETGKDELFRVIVENLQTRILRNSSSPDILALNLLYYRHFQKTVTKGSRITTSQLAGTPMLRIAYNIIREAAAIYPWLVREYSLNDYIAENQESDSSYNTFSGNIENVLFSTRLDTRNKADGINPFGLRSFATDFDGDSFNLENSLLEQDLDNAGSGKRLFTSRSFTSVRELPPEQIGKLGFAIIRIVGESEFGLTLADIAAKLKLPYYTIQRKLIALRVY